MSPFTLFFARLVELLGAETAAKLVREFAGQTIQFPVTGHNEHHQVRPVTRVQAAELLRVRMAYQPTAEDISFRDAVLTVAEACNVSLSAAIRLLMAERQRSTAPLSSAGTAPAPDQSGSEGHAAPVIPPEADPNQ